MTATGVRRQQRSFAHMPKHDESRGARHVGAVHLLFLRLVLGLQQQARDLCQNEEIPKMVGFNFSCGMVHMVQLVLPRT